MKISPQKSMFNYIGGVSLVQNGDYSIDDEYIYVDNKTVRKQLNKIHGFEPLYSPVWVWMPSIQDISTLEKRYHKQVEHSQKLWKERLEPLFDKIVEMGEAHAHISHPYKGEDIAPWWLYKGDERGISFQWVEEPENPVNLEIGQAYYSTDRYSNSVYNRRNKFRIALERALILKLDELTGTNYGYFHKQTKYSAGQQVQLIINDRSYWFKAEYNSHGTLGWVILSWPESEVVQFKL